MSELDHKEGWAPTNWLFWTVMLEKTLESSLNSKEIQPVHPHGDQSWVSWEGLMLNLNFGQLMWRDNLLEETLILGKTESRRRRGWRRRVTEDEVVGWHHQFNGHEFEQALGDGEGQRSLACCGSWGGKESYMTEWLNWTEHYTCHYLPSCVLRIVDGPLYIPCRSSFLAEATTNLHDSISQIGLCVCVYVCMYV